MVGYHPPAIFSYILTSAVALLEAVFQTHFPILMRNKKIRQQLKSKSFDQLKQMKLKSDECNCKPVDLIINIFVTIHIHHELKILN